MEPLSEIAGLQRAVASGLTEDLARVHGSSTKNLQATLQTCQDHLSASVDCASRVQKASIAIGDSLSTGNRTESLRASLQEALKVEEQTKQKLQGLESEYITKRLQLQNELHANLEGQKERHLKISGGILS